MKVLRGFLGALGQALWLRLSWVLPHKVTVYNRATIQVLIYPYYEYDSTVTECGQYPTYTPNPCLKVHAFPTKNQGDKMLGFVGAFGVWDSLNPKP